MQTRIAQTISFGRDGDAEPYQLGGWSEPERGFAWSVGPECALLLPRPDAPWGCFVEIEGVAFAAPPRLPGQRIVVKANGHIVGRILLTGPSVAAFYVPALDDLDSGLVITIEHADATRPRDVSDSADSRELAFAFYRVRMLTLTEPHEPWAGDVSFRALPSGNLTERLEELVGLPARQFVTNFESLGDNCELGFVQRSCGAEPLGLLRFSTALAVPVLQGIDDGFVGVTDHIEPRLEERPQGPREWMIHQRTYQMRYHTFVNEGDASADEMSAREAMKLRFLGRKLVEDITEANKTFLMKRHHPQLSYAEALPIFLALKRKNSRNRLLWLSQADGNHPAGLVHEVHPGLMQGYMDRLWPPHDPSLATWLTVLANAWWLAHSAA
jgi:hypothetical protein